MTQRKPTGTSTAIPCVIYAAKSTDDTRGSIPTQLDDCRMTAEREGWDVVGEFSDEGFSAFKDNRGPNLERAKQAAVGAAEQSGECMLVVQHSDRLARGAGDGPGAADHLGELFFQLRRQGVTIYTERNGKLNDPLRAALEGERNTEDSQRKSEATRAGKRRRAERGESTGPLAFGYRLVPREDGEGKARVPDPDEAPLVREAFAMLDAGRSIGAIVRWLNNDRGAKTKRGNGFDRLAVRRMLGNPYYAGKVIAYGEVLDGNHEPLMEWEEFQRISGKLKQHSAASRGGRPPARPHLLTGVMCCAHCGNGIWLAQPKKKDGRRTYVCGNVRHATGLCSAPRFDAGRAERAVIDHLDSLFVDMGAWIDRLSAERAGQRDGVARALTALNDRRAELQRDEDDVRADYRRQLREGDDGAARVAATEVERIEAERAELDEQAADLDARLGEWNGADPADEALDWWNDLGKAIRGEIVNAKTVKEANQALRERFAAIFVRSTEEGGLRMDFVLKDRESDAPVVAARLWPTSEEEHRRAQEEGSFLVDFVADESLDAKPIHSGG